MGVAKFEIELTSVGVGSKVVVDGQDVSNQVASMALLAKPGEPTVLQLQMFTSGLVKGEGIVETYIDNLKTMRVWLSQVNSQEVDRRAMDRGTWGDGSTLTDHVLDVLLEMIDETESASDS